MLMGNQFPYYLTGSNINEAEMPVSHQAKVPIVHEDGSEYPLPVMDAPLLFHFALNDYRTSPALDPMLDMFDAFCGITGITYKSILRVRINIDFPRAIRSVSPWHIDYTFDHNSFIYYVNDSDGDTVIYAERYGDERPKMTVAEIITPKAGRGVVFDGNHYHSAGAPYSAAMRVAVNICFV